MRNSSQKAGCMPRSPDSHCCQTRRLLATTEDFSPGLTCFCQLAHFMSCEILYPHDMVRHNVTGQFIPLSPRPTTADVVPTRRTIHMSIIESITAIGPVARVLLLIGMVIVSVLCAHWITERIGFEDKDGIDITAISNRIKSQQLELAAITTRTENSSPLARSLARTDSVAQHNQKPFYPHVPVTNTVITKRWQHAAGKGSASCQRANPNPVSQQLSMTADSSFCD